MEHFCGLQNIFSKIWYSSSGAIHASIFQIFFITNMAQFRFFLSLFLVTYHLLCSDNTIAWQPNNQQQANVSVTVSSVWGVSSSPSLVNPMMPMQSGGGMTQGVGSQYDPSGNQMKPIPNQGRTSRFRTCNNNVGVNSRSSLLSFLHY